MHETEKTTNSRYKKMFDLLRQGDLHPQPVARSRSAATAARYLDGDAASRFIARSVASLKVHSLPPQNEKTRPSLRAFAKLKPSNEG